MEYWSAEVGWNEMQPCCGATRSLDASFFDPSYAHFCRSHSLATQEKGKLITCQEIGLNLPLFYP